MARSYAQHTAKSCQIRTTVSLPFKRPLHAGCMVVQYLGPSEIFRMSEILPFVRQCAQRVHQPRKNQKWIWAEFNLVEMFPNIERFLVLTALRRLHAEVLKKRG